MKTFIERSLDGLMLDARLAIRYGKMFGGRSYQHRYQGLGRPFVPGRLAGYYNDLSDKTEWHGRVDHVGIPIIPAPGRKLDYHAIGVLQKALGHWDVWLGSEKQSTQRGTLASPYYHRLHIAQLEALELTYPEHESQFGKLRKSFDEHLASPLNVTRAVAIKGYQKLQHPPEELKR
jgi:hypothetical protein